MKLSSSPFDILETEAGSNGMQGWDGLALAGRVGTACTDQPGTRRKPCLARVTAGLGASRGQHGWGRPSLGGQAPQAVPQQCQGLCSVALLCKAAAGADCILCPASLHTCPRVLGASSTQPAAGAGRAASRPPAQGLGGSQGPEEHRAR